MPTQISNGTKDVTIAKFFYRFDAPGLRDLRPVLWLFLPAFVAFAPLIGDFWYAGYFLTSDDVIPQQYTETDYFAVMWGERGVIELLTVVFLVMGAAAGIGILRHADKLPARWLKGFFAIGVLGCILFAGEELSWGQHFFGWTVSDRWSEINWQQETNLHNTDAFNRFVPLAFLRYAILAGTLLPIFFFALGHRLDPARWTYWFVPTYVCLPSGLAILWVAMPLKRYYVDIIGNWYPVYSQFAPHECLIGLATFLYLYSVLERLKQMPSAEHG